MNPAAALAHPIDVALVDEWTGLVVENLQYHTMDALTADLSYGTGVEFDGRAWHVVSVAHTSSHFTRVTLREISA